MSLTTRSRSTARTLRAGALGVLAGLALAACVSIPTSGPVTVGIDSEDITEPASVEPLGDLPAENADPEDIVRGFLNASAAGFSRETSATATDDFKVAREYLSGETATTWNPRDRVVVYPTASSPVIKLVDDTQVQVHLPVAARINADGQYAQAGPDAQESLVFDLVQDSSGQWRISGLDDGVVLSEPNFELVYRSTSLYFLSLDAQYLVPETRWFPVRNLATSIVRALLAGPSDWLRDGVRTAVQEGTTLTPDAVRVDRDGTAQVGLSRGSLPSEPADRALLLAQIEASLTVARVRSVEVTADGVPLDAEPATLLRGADSTTALEAIEGDALVQLSQGSFVPVEGVGSLAGLDARSPARNESGDLRVLLSGPDTLVLAPTPTEAATVLLTGDDLVAPSVDRLGWVWTASGTATDGALSVVDAAGRSETFVVEWLAGRTVRSLRVSADGSRIALVSSGPDGVAVHVTSVVRDDSGTPQQLGAPLATGITLVDATQVVWLDESTLGVLGRSGTATTALFHLVPIAGETTARPVVVDALTIAGKSDSMLYIATSGGVLYTRSGPSWNIVADGVREPSFPG